MKNILARGGVEFLAVFLGIALSLWVDEYQKSMEFAELNNQILKRLYDNLEADSKDAIWNSKAYEVAMIGSKKVFEWCDNGQPKSDSIDIYISSIAINTIFVNNDEEYNALKSSGRMELIKNQDLIKALHDYYTEVNFIKASDERIRNKVDNHFVPFMLEYTDFFAKDSNKIVFDMYWSFHLIKNPPISKLKNFASSKQTYSNSMMRRYRKIAKDVDYIRNMIKEELENE